VVLAGPANAMAPIARGLDQVLSYLLATVPYAGVACINLAFRREQLPDLPQAAGFVVPAVEQRTTIACTFADRKYGGRAPDTHVLLRAFVGGALGEAQLERDDATLVEGVLGDLRDLLGLQGLPLFARVHRWPKAMAQFVLGHGDRLKVIRAREAIVPGLALVGNAYEGVGIPDLAAQAEAAADRLVGARLPPTVDNDATRADTA
jgi:oxygen-dependent protoporphyrinogen oxidase